MKKKLLLTFLLFRVIASYSEVQAATSASQTLSATLGSLVNITADNTAVLTATIDPDTGNLSQNLTSKFNILLNQNASLYLRATVQNSTSSNESAFFKNGSTVYVILGNTTNKPLTTAIANIKTATPDAAQNANAIAYPIQGVVLTGTSASVVPNFNITTNQYEIAALAGASAATTTFTQNALTNTYSYLDTAGTYQAIVTLTSSPT